MKSLIKKRIRENLSFSNRVMKAFKNFDNIYTYAWKCSLDQKVINKLCGNNIVVVDGVFSGLVYPSQEATGSALGLKIAGVYEEELSSVIEEIIQRKYDEVWDVGAAEGYYAIGLAKKCPALKVVAYDINPYARKLLEKMAVANNVKDRVRIESWCTPETVLNYKFNGKTLIICDCEGYEKELLSESTVGALADTDILVEVHDNLDKRDENIGNQIRTCFNKTHNITEIESLALYEKAYKHSDEERFSFLSDKELLRFMEERERKMKWFFMKANRGDTLERKDSLYALRCLGCLGIIASHCKWGGMDQMEFPYSSYFQDSFVFTIMGIQK